MYNVKESKASLALYLLLLLVLLYARALNQSSISIPTYCVDDQALSIFDKRWKQCIGYSSVTLELTRLQSHSVVHYQRASELLAYQYFVENKNNIHRRNCAEADIEYIPLLPLSWKVEFIDDILCTTGGICHSTPVKSDDSCGTRHIISSIVEFNDLLQKRRQSSSHREIPRFMVSSAENLKTVMGRGMSSLSRSGMQYEIVSNFIETTYLAHYERLPQCADLLRKQWKHIIEIPFIPIFDFGKKWSVAKSSSIPVAAFAQSTQKFFFSGRFILYGSERVCSVRVAILQLHKRTDTVIVHINESQTRSSPIIDKAYYNFMEYSDFCLIARADSYSTSFFYEAIQAGCIPVVISDWFAFSYWWFIPYKEFVIRIKEETFMSNPNDILDYISGSFSRDSITEMKIAMKKWSKYLNYASYYNQIKKGNQIASLDLMTAELFWTSKLYRMTDNLFDSNKKIKNENSDLCFNPELCLPRVEYLNIPSGVFTDNRSHLCRHAPRLIGRYKIVYFMQCVRMLWALRPGQFKPIDLGSSGQTKLSDYDVLFIKQFHNVSTDRLKPIQWMLYPQIEEQVLQWKKGNILEFVK